MTGEELQALCLVWQERLGLRDWDVAVRIVRARELDEPGSEGQVNWVLERREALIKLLDPVDYMPDGLVPEDMELGLVHELIHLHFAPFEAKEESLEHTCQEQAIDALSKALVRLAREKWEG